jgi:hypothetical protein
MEPKSPKIGFSLFNFDNMMFIFWNIYIYLAYFPFILSYFLLIWNLNLEVVNNSCFYSQTSKK